MFSFVPLLFASAVLAILGWGGLVILILGTTPTLGPRWLFFFFLMLALSGTFLPVINFLHRRFPSNPPVKDTVLVRESILVGIYGCLMAWLQLGRILTFSLAVIVACGMILIEVLLRWGEQSQFKAKG